MKVTRRDFTALSMGLPLLGGPFRRASGMTPAPVADWPQWAPGREAIYAGLARAARDAGQDIRTFGARMDGSSDDTAAFERALQTADVLTIPGGAGTILRLTRQLRISRPITIVGIVGIGGRPTIRWEGSEKDLFVACLPGDDAHEFLCDVRIDSIAFERPAPLAPHGMVLRGYNLRGVSVTRCAARRMGMVGLHHARQRLRQYFRSRGSITEDPAVVAGFSASQPDDLCEDLFVLDCDVDAETHTSQLARFDFTRRVIVAGNRGRFASISWWGGGGRREEGGDLRHLRRVRDVYVCDNSVSGSIGGVYGNNGQNIHVARNRVSMVTDIGIDFEGCIDVMARDNIVENAGNFCYATLFATRNVLFENNIGTQDGGATDIHLKYGARKVGQVSGRTLFALRSAGFGAEDGAVAVAYRGNQFAWKGREGLGYCLPSFFSEFELTGNRFENVICNLAYRMTRRLTVRDNVFTFDRAPDRSAPLISASADTVEIVGNRVTTSGAYPADSAAVLVTLSAGGKGAHISRNQIQAERQALPIVVQGSGAAAARSQIVGNMGADIVVPASLDADLRDNLAEAGRAAHVIRKAGQ